MIIIKTNGVISLSNIKNSPCRHTTWNFIYIVLNFIVICSLSSALISSTSSVAIKEVNATETYVRNLSKILLIKQDLDHTASQDLNQHVKEGSVIKKTITIDPFQNSNNINRHSSITKQTNDGLYNVILSWIPADLTIGRNTIFTIMFVNHKTSIEVKQIDYSFRAIVSLTNITIKEVKHQKAPIGSGVQIVKFPLSGRVNISINFTVSQQPSQTGSINNNNVTSSILENVAFYIVIPPKSDSTAPYTRI